MLLWSYQDYEDYETGRSHEPPQLAEQSLDL